jgi:hypothetical protein
VKASKTSSQNKPALSDYKLMLGRYSKSITRFQPALQLAQRRMVCTSENCPQSMTTHDCGR